jgi:hypothetical protein
MGSVDTRRTEEDPENDHHLTTPADSHFAKHEAEQVAEVPISGPDKGAGPRIGQFESNHSTSINRWCQRILLCSFDDVE